MVKIKICSLSTQEAIATAVEEGADYIGFVFAPSKRQVSIETAHLLARTIPDHIQKVGVFVSPSLEELRTAVVKVPLDLVQIHGLVDETIFPELGVPVIWALQVTLGQPIPESQADYFLFDAPVAGSGQVFDWSSLDTDRLTKPFFIAGGLTADNVSAAKSHFNPYGLDVSSGVETDGQKDPEKIRQFIERGRL